MTSGEYFGCNRNSRRIILSNWQTVNEIIKVNPEPLEQPVVRQASTEDQLIALWLHGRSKGTKVVYAADSKQFLMLVSKPLHEITLGDLQSFADHLEQTKLRQRWDVIWPPLIEQNVLAFGCHAGLSGCHNVLL
jgi:hypothetical protein